MAIHIFECPKCKIQIELQRSINDESIPLCCEDGCNALEMEQIIVASNFHLKGLGWSAEGYSKTGVD